MNINILKTLAFPWYLFDQSGDQLDFFHGSLFELDERATSEKCQTFYATISKDGWSVCPEGYAVYSRSIELDSPVRLIIPGLKITGISHISGKTDALQIKLQSNYVEEHVETILEMADNVEDVAHSIVRNTVHNFRAVNSNIYNAAYECERLINAPPHMQQSSARKEPELIGNIVALSGIMSAQMDIIDLQSSFESIKARKPSRIPVYKKFDKIVRCLTSSANKKNVWISFSGRCYLYTEGPDVFELIPYILLENAVKYAPPDTEILCSVTEDHYNIIASVQSRGPQIREDEVDKIFSSGYRGVYVRNRNFPGDGLGLAVLKKAVESLYSGKIHLEPNINNDFERKDDTNYMTNKFECTFPIVD